MRQSTRRWRTVPIGAGLLALLAAVGWRYVRASYASTFLDATWAASPNAADGVVWGRVANWNGTPAVDQQVEAADAGGARVATTDADGRFEIHIRDEPTRLTVVGIDTIPLSRWNLPSGTGVRFDVHLKRPPPPERGPL